MERLTNHDTIIQYVITANEPTWRAIYDKLCEYEDAEEQGLLVRLPKAVYEAVLMPGFYGVIEWEVISVSYDLEKKQLYRVAVKRNTSDKVLYDEKLGTSVFLTREEAEAALKEG